LTKLSFKWNFKFRRLTITIFSVKTSLTNINKQPYFVPLNILLLNNLKNQMLADFYIPRLSNNMKIAVEKNNLRSQICYRSLDPVKKNGLKFSNTKKFLITYQQSDFLFYFFRCFIAQTCINSGIKKTCQKFLIFFRLRKKNYKKIIKLKIWNSKR